MLLAGFSPLAVSLHLALWHPDHPFPQAQGKRVLDPAFWGEVHFEYYLPGS